MLKLINETPYLIMNAQPTSPFNYKRGRNWLVPVYYPLGTACQELPKEFKNKLQEISKRYKNKVTFPYNLKPMPHQIEGVNLLANFMRAALFYECGTGKTKIIIDYLNYLKLNGKLNGKIIILTRAVTLAHWKNQFEIHGINLPFPIILKGSDRQDKLNLLKKDYTILVAGYETIGLKDRKSLNIINNKPGYVYEKILNQKFQLMVCDESHYIKNSRSQRSEFVEELSKNTKQRVIMSGSASTGSPIDLFQQFRILDPSILGNSRDTFVKTYTNSYHPKNNPNKFVRIIKSYKNLDTLKVRVNYITKYAGITEVYKGELKVFPYYVELRGEQKDIYSKVLNNLSYILRTVEEETELLKLRIYEQPTIIDKLRQITSGFIQNYWIKEKEIIKEKFNENIKLEALESLINEIPHKKLIIWYTYIQDRDNILACIKSYNPKAKIFGKTSYLEFEKADEGYYVEQIRTGIGIDLVSTNYSIFYTIDYYDNIYQAMGRTLRKGQKENAVIAYFLVGKNTVDELLWKLYLDKKQVAEYLNSRIHSSLSQVQLTKLLVKDLIDLWEKE